MKILNFLIIFFVFTALLLSTQTAHAQNIDFGVYPPVFQIQTTPPSSIKAPLTIQNYSDSSINLIVSLKPFTAAPSENGDVQFLSDLSAFPDPTLLGKVNILEGDNPIQTLTLAPKQKKNLTLEIALPKDQAKGDYYMSLVFTSNAQTPNGNIAQAQASIASNILLSIGPLGPTQGVLDNFFAPLFTTQGPVPFTVRVKNTSDHYITPKGDIVIKNMFGQAVGKVNLLPVNILSSTMRIIPDSVQSNTNSKDYAKIAAVVANNEFPVAVWPEKFLVGPYTATITLALSNTGPLFKRSIVFFAFPLEYIIGLIIIIIMIVFIVLRVRKKIS